MQRGSFDISVTHHPSITCRLNIFSGLYRDNDPEPPNDQIRNTLTRQERRFPCLSPSLVPLVTEVLSPHFWCDIPGALSMPVTLGCVVLSPTFSLVASFPTL